MGLFLERVSILLSVGKKTVKKQAGLFLLALLALVSLIVYLSVSHRYILSTEQIAFFDQSAGIEQVYKTIEWPEDQKNNIRIIYFWQAYCPCDATVIPHFKELYKEHSDENVDFYLADLSPLALQNNNNPSYERPFSHVLDSDISNLFRPFISHAPSVAIWDKNNELTYYGPHNLGFVCNADTSFVKKVVDSLLQNIQSKNINILGNSCFCAL